MRMLFLALFLIVLALPDPAAASRFGAIIEGPAGGWLIFVCALAGLLVFAALCRQISVYLTEATHSSRVARVMDVLANQAEGIAGALLAHPPASAATLQTVREAMIAQSVAYAKINLPVVVGQIGASDGVLATRLSNFVVEKLRETAPVEEPGTAAQGAMAAASPQPAALPA